MGTPSVPPPGGMPPPAPGSPGAPVPAYPYYNPAYPAYPGPYSPGGMGWPGNREVESRALRMVRLACVIGLIGAILGSVAVFAIPYYTGTSFFGSFPTTPVNGTANNTFNNTTFVHAIGKLVTGFAVFGIIGVILSIITAYFFRQGFALLRPFDSRFGTPASFMIVLIVGLILLIPGIALLAAGANTLTNCVANSNLNSTATAKSCSSSLGSFVGSFALIALGGIIAFIGLIGGPVLGSWRLGTRYNTTLFKVGAIFLIFFSLIGYILVLIDAHSTANQLAAAPPSQPPPGQPGYPPPGMGMPPPRP